MAAKKVGTLIKEARINADMTQEQLARRIPDLSASDISLAERGKMALTQAQLKLIAKATGVTQASLIDAAKESSSARKTSSAKSSSGSKSTIKVSAAEKKLVELYRAADSDTKKAAVKLLKGEDSTTGMIIEDILESVQDIFDGK